MHLSGGLINKVLCNASARQRGGHLMHLYFSDVFDVSPKVLDKYGAFNISLVTDLPLFIDPFLLFNSRKKQYQQLHDDIIKYLRFLKDKSTAGTVNSGLLWGCKRCQALANDLFSREMGKGEQPRYALRGNNKALIIILAWLFHRKMQFYSLFNIRKELVVKRSDIF